jgi:hypothetical protein
VLSGRPERRARRLDDAKVEHDGIKKRCPCGRRKWAKCSHPWHFGFHFRGREYRLSLHKQAQKSADYVMSKTEAESLRDLYRSQIRAGSFVAIGGAPVQPDPPPVETRLTFGAVAEHYLDKHVRHPDRRQAGRRLMEW